MTRRTTTWTTTGVLLVAGVIGVAAHETTYKGTVESTDTARVQVRTIDDEGKVADKATWFAVTEATKVTRGDTAVPFVDARAKPGERIVVVVAHGDEAAIEWTCPMHSHIALDKAGKCPVCSMTLKERERPAKASQIKLAPR